LRQAAPQKLHQEVQDMRTKRVLIVGGGSAGWTAAAYFNAALKTGDQKVAEISLFEAYGRHGRLFEFINTA
jgi:ribulose 1,5-bisphosphate synthetase/thiazole synthase